MEAASRSGRHPPGRVGACPHALAFAFALLFLLPAPLAFAATLGGAYYVDDAEIGKRAPARSNPGARLPPTAIVSPSSARPAWSISVDPSSWAQTW
jgi:hypothetical protein